jgi:hypothetical protein
LHAPAAFICKAGNNWRDQGDDRSTTPSFLHESDNYLLLLFFVIWHADHKGPPVLAGWFLSKGSIRLPTWRLKFEAMILIFHS